MKIVGCLVVFFCFVACSNSDNILPLVSEVNFVENEVWDLSWTDDTSFFHNTEDGDAVWKNEIIPVDDSDYPYAGIPRIIIETERKRKIRDVQTEIPAKLQIWGAHKPESAVLDLTIRGRGNTSWKEMPKKSYKIEFTEKQNLLGMPKNRDWALVANHADKTLLKNFLMYRLYAKLGAFYSPRCEFVELYLNGEYLGIYLLTETVKIGKNRVDIPEWMSYIIEVDGHIRKDEQSVFSDILKDDGVTFRVHSPKNATDDQLLMVENYIHSFEYFLKNIIENKDNNVEQWIDLEEYVRYYWVQEFAKNSDAAFFTSVYFSWTNGQTIRMGPVWDFDLSFGGHPNEINDFSKGWCIRLAYWNKYLFKDSLLSMSIKKYWFENRNTFNEVFGMIDSSAQMLNAAAKNNFRKWNILSSTELRFHRKPYNSYQDAVEDLKKWIREHMDWIDEQY